MKKHYSHLKDKHPLYWAGVATWLLSAFINAQSAYLLSNHNPLIALSAVLIMTLMFAPLRNRGVVLAVLLVHAVSATLLVMPALKAFNTLQDNTGGNSTAYLQSIAQYEDKKAALVAQIGGLERAVKEDKLSRAKYGDVARLERREQIANTQVYNSNGKYAGTLASASKSFSRNSWYCNNTYSALCREYRELNSGTTQNVNTGTRDVPQNKLLLAQKVLASLDRPTQKGVEIGGNTLKQARNEVYLWGIVAILLELTILISLAQGTPSPTPLSTDNSQHIHRDSAGTELGHVPVYTRTSTGTAQNIVNVAKRMPKATLKSVSWRISKLRHEEFRLNTNWRRWVNAQHRDNPNTHDLTNAQDRKRKQDFVFVQKILVGYVPNGALTVRQAVELTKAPQSSTLLEELAELPRGSLNKIRKDGSAGHSRVTATLLPVLEELGFLEKQHKSYRWVSVMRAHNALIDLQETKLREHATNA